MLVWGALAGGAVGATLLSSGYRLAEEVGWTRMDIPFLLGTAFTENRRAATFVGWFVHFVNGLAFALLYAAVFAATGLTTWWFGLALGAVHAGFVGGALVNVLLPVVHPRMGTPWTDSEETPLLEPPGFMLANYGRGTALVTLVLHLIYGTVVGAFAAGLG
jgi:Na+(H+)/acetate symporter ActP